ncbi:DeoR/GlpR family DNA-binding transcription regulator [Williamsia sp.]|uniref:DeoR/GlpR family DNA-binding transcription regulator n=1 Tax=Williamsia sp. TaxID=1872085 RepID=UPI001A2D8A8F|nr:DeoR/GlpR family DNA-binding transcription regulator [Williamsia sp.]MBJ7291486.1 DeoR/GlpR transcriptional regulator [Williamsia sp.]
MLAVERRRRILDALERDGTVRVASLAADLGVSEMTVRRDLDALDDREALHKVHGGAVSRHNRGEEPWSAIKATQQRPEKVAIAHTALELVENGMTVAISAGTTTLELARLLGERTSITVVTNSISIFQELTDPQRPQSPSNPEVFLTGGSRTPSDALVGPIADAALSTFRVDVSFLGVHGVDLDAGLTTPNIAEAQTNRRLVDIGRSLVVLADHTKYLEVGANVIAPLSRVDTLVSDATLTESARTELSGHVTDLRIAPVDHDRTPT